MTPQCLWLRWYLRLWPSLILAPNVLIRRFCGAKHTWARPVTHRYTVDPTNLWFGPTGSESRPSPSDPCQCVHSGRSSPRGSTNCLTAIRLSGPRVAATANPTMAGSMNFPRCEASLLHTFLDHGIDNDNDNDTLREVPHLSKRRPGLTGKSVRSHDPRKRICCAVEACSLARCACTKLLKCAHASCPEMNSEYIKRKT